MSEAVRSRLAVALDVATATEALALAKAIEPWAGVAKVGLELWSAEGVPVVSALRGLGFDVFLDVKLHDIPTTVGRAATVLGRLGVRYLNFHTAGGLDMVRAGVEGLRAGAAAVGVPAPVALGVTVLTSDPGATEALLRERAEIARDAGCEGVVCAATDIATVRGVDPALVTVVPGIRPAGADVGDQARVATPGDAVRAGASVLVVGRPINAAADPAAAAAAVADEMAAALAGA